MSEHTNILHEALVDLVAAAKVFSDEEGRLLAGIIEKSGHLKGDMPDLDPAEVEVIKKAEWTGFIAAIERYLNLRDLFGGNEIKH